MSSTNFTANAGQLILPNPTGDVRASLTVNSNGVYQYKYKILSNISDLNNLGYYFSGSDPEYVNLPINGSPALSTLQATLVNQILNSTGSDLYSVYFADVANINFIAGSTNNSHITFGQTANNTQSAYIISYDNPGAPLATNIEKKHGDVWLNAESTHIWDISGKGAYAHWTILHEVGHSLGLWHPRIATIDNHKFSVMSYDRLPGMDPVGTPNIAKSAKGRAAKHKKLRIDKLLNLAIIKIELWGASNPKMLQNMRSIAKESIPFSSAYCPHSLRHGHFHCRIA